MHEKITNDEYELKLTALRAKLQAGEDSPLIENFSPEEFLNYLRSKPAERLLLTDEDREWLNELPMGKEIL
jgi:hypothetical protein